MTGGWWTGWLVRWRRESGRKRCRISPRRATAPHDPSTGAFTRIEGRDARIRAMQNPSASNAAGLRDSAARSGIGADRTKALHDSAASATGAPTPSRGSRVGMADHGDAGFFRIERDRATGWDSARAQLAPDPQGVGSLLGRAGEARSGFCREVKRRHAESSTSPSHRRLTSRQVPDCLRGPTEERAHTRNPTTPNPSPPRQPRHPTDPGNLSEGRAPAGGEILKPQPTPPTQRAGGWSDEPGGAKRPPTPRRPPQPDTPPTPSRSSIRSRLFRLRILRRRRGRGRGRRG